MALKPLSGDCKIAVIGLGYVGLPLAHAFAVRYPTLGFDINSRRIEQIRQGLDVNQALTPEELAREGTIEYTCDGESLSGCDVFIVTVPTPVDTQKQPDLGAIRNASFRVGSCLKAGNIVVYESTVYPGATEEVCVPILEQESGLRCNEDFYVGYSPERINPGDSAHSLGNIVKVTSGSCPEAAEFIDALYSSIIPAGTHRASSIKVAEAAKVIENTQRDLNIALINELAILFDKMNLNTREVLAAAGSKWNFLPFKPGLVGGHCIGVDPYYLTFKAQQLGYHPDVILAGRRINDNMGQYVADRVVKLMMSRRIHVLDSRILVLGLTFKENCPDTRNSRVFDVIQSLANYHANVEVYDPWVNQAENPDITFVTEPEPGRYDAVVVAVGHNAFQDLGFDAVKGYGKDRSVLFDVKGLFPSERVDGSL
ncbi:MAG: nucleotide sugar dehydrogenase [Pseudohongiellaceae bacterium]